MHASSISHVTYDRRAVAVALIIGIAIAAGMAALVWSAWLARQYEPGIVPAPVPVAPHSVQIPSSA